MTAVAEAAVFALDSDVLIYASQPGHQIGTRVRALFADAPRYRLCGSVFLIAETLIKPLRLGITRQVSTLQDLLGRMELRSADDALCKYAVALGVKYRLASTDAIHLATAAHSGAHVFLTNNSKDFDPDLITEIDVIFPDDLP